MPWVLEDFLGTGDGGGTFLTRTAVPMPMPMPMVEERLGLACFGFNPLDEDFFLILKMSAMLVVARLWEAWTLSF